MKCSWQVFACQAQACGLSAPTNLVEKNSPFSKANEHSWAFSGVVFTASVCLYLLCNDTVTYRRRGREWGSWPGGPGGGASAQRLGSPQPEHPSTPAPSPVHAALLCGNRGKIHHEWWAAQSFTSWPIRTHDAGGAFDPIFARSPFQML